jgi:hypothetical protein
MPGLRQNDSRTLYKAKFLFLSVNNIPDSTILVVVRQKKVFTPSVKTGLLFVKGWVITCLHYWHPKEIQ